MEFGLMFDRERFSLYPWYFADQCLTKDIEEVFGIKVSKVILEFKKSHVYYYVIIEEYNKIGKYLYDKIVSDKKFYLLAEKNVLVTGKELINFCKGIPKKLTNHSDSEIYSYYQEYGEKLKKMRLWGWIPALVDGAFIYFLSDNLQDKLKKHMESLGKASLFSEHYSILSSGDNMSEVQTEELERLKLILKLQAIKQNFIEDLENPQIKKLIKKHAKKFSWLTYSYIGPEMNEQDVINLIKESLKNPKTIQEHIEAITNHYKNIKIRKKEIISELKLPIEIVYLSKISSFFMELKDMRKGIYQKSYVYMDLIILEISKRIGLSVEETKYLNSEEIKEALFNMKDFKEIAKERTEYCVAVTENGITNVFNGEEAQKIVKGNVVKNEEYKDITEFKGSVAYSGKAKGIVKIILVKNDVLKLNEGDILVSSATNPDLITAMKKAAAFITDTGGITCHAAIVSRELKIPCIVGTKIATKVLNDGDYVEVDADNGIVKILERKT